MRMCWFRRSRMNLQIKWINKNVNRDLVRAVRKDCDRNMSAVIFQWDKALQALTALIMCYLFLLLKWFMQHLINAAMFMWDREDSIKRITFFFLSITLSSKGEIIRRQKDTEKEKFPFYRVGLMCDVSVWWLTSWWVFLSWVAMIIVT